MWAPAGPFPRAPTRQRPLSLPESRDMSWSFGLFVVLVCFLIVLACLAVKVFFKPGLALTTVRVRRARARRLTTTRTPVAGREEARRAALATGLPRALAGTTGLSPAVLVTFGLAGWLYWRILVSHRHALDTWLVWTFNVVFIIVAAQLVLACFEGRMIGQRDDHRIAVLIPLYNEDPDVVRRMLRALLHQSTPPAEIHVVDDGSSQGAYPEQRDWFLRDAAVAGIYATWQRTRNRGKRHAQSQAFQQIRDADLFVTVDSDSMLDSEALHEIVQPFSDPRVMSVAGIILAINNKENLLARVTDMIFVGQQLIDRSSMSRLGAGQLWRSSRLPVPGAGGEHRYVHERELSGSARGILRRFHAHPLRPAERQDRPAAVGLRLRVDARPLESSLPSAGALVPRFLHPRSVAHSLPAGRLLGVVAAGHRVDADVGGDISLLLPGYLASARH